MIGTKVVVTRATMTGTETVLGHVVTPIHTAEETVTHVTVEGMVIAETIHPLPLPLEPERAVRLELVPVESRHPHLVKLEIL